MVRRTKVFGNWEDPPPMLGKIPKISRIFVFYGVPDYVVSHDNLLQNISKIATDQNRSLAPSPNPPQWASSPKPGKSKCFFLLENLGKRRAASNLQSFGNLFGLTVRCKYLWRLSCACDCQAYFGQAYYFLSFYKCLWRLPAAHGLPKSAPKKGAQKVKWQLPASSTNDRVPCKSFKMN